MRMPVPAMSVCALIGMLVVMAVGVLVLSVVAHEASRMRSA